MVCLPVLFMPHLFPGSVCRRLNPWADEEDGEARAKEVRGKYEEPTRRETEECDAEEGMESMTRGNRKCDEWKKRRMRSRSREECMHVYCAC